MKTDVASGKSMKSGKLFQFSLVQADDAVWKLKENFGKSLRTENWVKNIFNKEKPFLFKI